MRKTHHRRTREPCTVPGAGMRKPVGEDQIVLAHECRDHAEICQVTAAEDERALGPLQLGEQAARARRTADDCR